MIAAGHYLQQTDADWSRAVGDALGGAKCGAPEAQNPAQRQATPNDGKLQNSPKESGNAGSTQLVGATCDSPQNDLVGRAGLEPATPAFSMRCSTN